MTKIDVLAFFDREISKLSARNVSPYLFLDVLARPARCGLKADAACRYFSTTKTWPPLDEDTLCEVCLRLACARWYCDLPEFIGTSEDNWISEAELVEYLVSYWNDVGKRDWFIEGLAGD
jgi:hypothetical protein